MTVTRQSVRPASGLHYLRAPDDEVVTDDRTEEGFVDFRTLKTSDWLMLGGGAAMLVLGFVLPWTSIDLGAFGSDSGDGPFEYFFPGGVAWLLIVAVGALALLNVTGSLPPTQPWPLILLGLSGLGTLLMLLQLVMGPRFEQVAERGIGMWLSAVWAIVTTVGAAMSFQADGGRMKDLTDLDKLKSSFADRRETDSAPPPPPPPPPPAD
jgi:hypothetical protein